MPSDYPDPFAIFAAACVVAAVVFAVVTVFASLAETKRRETMAALAAFLRLEWAVEDPFQIEERYKYFGALAQGHRRSARNVIHGRLGDVEVKAFDYTYYTTEGTVSSTSVSGTRQARHTFSAIVCDTGYLFQPIVIRPENFFDRIAEVIGFEDIDFESDEFNRAFHVQCSDKKFAYDIVHPRMMEFLLARIGWSLEIRQSALLVCDGSDFSVEKFRAAIDFAQGFLELLPEYLKQQMQSSGSA